MMIVVFSPGNESGPAKSPVGLIISNITAAQTGINKSELVLKSNDEKATRLDVRGSL